jgi:hypothetical protein
MRAHPWARYFVLAASAGVATLASEPGRTQIGGKDWIAANVDLQMIDGPYSYKSPTNLIAIVVFVTETNGADVVLRECDGSKIMAKATEIMRIQRNCPSPGGTVPWTIDAAGKIVPLISYSTQVQFKGLDKAEIDPDQLPPEYSQQVKSAKPGEWVALSYPTDKGKLNLSVIAKTQAQ